MIHVLPHHIHTYQEDQSMHGDPTPGAHCDPELQSKSAQWQQQVRLLLASEDVWHGVDLGPSIRPGPT